MEPKRQLTRTPAEPAFRGLHGSSLLAPFLVAQMSAPLVLGEQAQALPQAVPSFEVATIRPSGPEERGLRVSQSEGYLLTNHTSLRDLIKLAYDIKSDRQVEAAPDWVSSDYFDVRAKTGAADLNSLAKLDSLARQQAMRLMVRSLLADRFQLKVSLKTEILPVYALMVAKSGLKLATLQESPKAAPASSDTPARASQAEATPAPAKGHSSSLNSNSQHLKAQGVSMEQLCEWISRQPEVGQRMVIDKTGLTSSYDLVLDVWNASHDDPGASIFNALQDQLGLMLKAKKLQQRC